MEHLPFSPQLWAGNDVLTLCASLFVPASCPHFGLILLPHLNSLLSVLCSDDALPNGKIMVACGQAGTTSWKWFLCFLEARDPDRLGVWAEVVLIMIAMAPT